MREVQALVTDSGFPDLGLAVGSAHWGRWVAVEGAIAAAIVWITGTLLFIASYSAQVMNLCWWALGPSVVAGAAGMLFAVVGEFMTHRHLKWHE
jgi:hypothetical protein